MCKLFRNESYLLNINNFLELKLLEGETFIICNSQESNTSNVKTIENYNSQDFKVITLNYRIITLKIKNSSELKLEIEYYKSNISRK